MTCSNDCRDCIYGVPKTSMECNNQNATCDGACYKCCWASEKSVRYICTSGVAYGRKGMR